jgi:hypothetical protein
VTCDSKDPSRNRHPSDLRSRRISAQPSTISTRFLPDSTLARVMGNLVNFSCRTVVSIQLPPTKDGRDEFRFSLKASNGETVASGRRVVRRAVPIEARGRERTAEDV